MKNLKNKIIGAQMTDQFKNLANQTILDINYYSYTEADAVFFLNTLLQFHPAHHLYITKENMRYYIRGLVAYDDCDVKYERYQLTLLAYFCDCNRFSGYGSKNDEGSVIADEE